MRIGQSGRPETVGERDKTMKKQLSGTFEFRGIEYDYTAEIYTGDDAYIYPDRITDLDRADREAIDEGVWEDAEFVALQNAYLVEWCEKESWEEEDTGGGCSALVKSEAGGMVTRITRESDPSAPRTMGEPVCVGRYSADDKLIGNVQQFKGGINEWIADPAVSRWSPYSDLITEIARKLGRENINPRWVEAFMSLEYPSLNSISRKSFEREVKTAINCIDALGPEKAEQCAQSFGL